MKLSKEVKKSQYETIQVIMFEKIVMALMAHHKSASSKNKYEVIR